MKRMNDGVKRIGAAVVALTAGLAIADTYTLSSVSSGTDSLTSGTYWSGGIAPSDQAATNHDFTVSLSGIRTPTGETAFHCHSLTLGEAGKNVQLYMKEGNWTFPEDSAGVTFARVQMDDWTAGTTTYSINGPVTFSDAFSKTGSGRYACQFYTAKEANAVVHAFTGKVTASADARLKNYLKNPTNGRHYGIRFSGDLTAFEGEMEMGASSRLEIGTTTMPGTINVTGTDVIIAPTAGSAGFSVGTLTLASDTTLEMSFNRDTGACQPITVTGKLTSSTFKIKIAAETYTAGTTVPERKYKILSFPTEGSTFDADSVSVVSDTVAVGDFVPQVETADGVTTLYLVRAAVYEIVTRVAGGEGYLEDGATWSDGLTPHANAEYLSASSVSGNLRLWATNSPYVFPGKKLTVQGGNMIAQCNDITISNLEVTADANMLNWHPGAKVPASFSPNGIRYYRGDIALTGGALSFSSQVPVHFVFDGDISGAKRLNVYQNQSTGTFDSPLYVELTGKNTFTALLNTWTKNATSFDTGVVLCFSSGANLGGNPASFVYNANNLGAYVAYRATASTTLETMNRGIAVNNAAFDTPEGVTLTVRQTIQYAGDLTKLGAGTLVLSNDHSIATAVTSTLHVAEGFLKVAESNAVTGITLAFTNNAALKVDLDAESVTGGGLRNVALEEPFVIDTDDGKIHVKIDADPMPTHGRAPICTVSTAAAAGLRGKFVVDKPAKGFRGVVTERVFEEGTVTFAAEIEPVGLVVIFR